jgi:predicted phage terminase large subunit-like protein
MTVKLSADLLEAFAGMYLSPMYDNPQPVAPFHRECWESYCDMEIELAARAAPRSHAKSTALTHAFAMAVACFRVQDYIVVVSATEALAMDHLGDIAAQFRENDDLREDFQVSSLPVDARGEVEVLFKDGHRCRFIAKGSGQKMRGLKWRGKRPGLILGDDLEEDEQVENRDRRQKFLKWIYRALIPCKRKGGVVRIQGTILHEDAFLARVMKDSRWNTKLYKAHAAFDDFTDILWPEQFSEERLHGIRQMFINQGDAAGYSQEYLNDPFDNAEAYLHRDWFRPMNEDDYESSKLVCAAADFAISKADKANRTSLTVGGKDVGNLLHIIDQRVGRWDSYEIIENLFAVHRAHRPDVFFVEKGHIWQTLYPIVKKEMAERDIWINFVEFTASKDKATRGRSLQKRMRAHGVRFDKRAEWYPPYEAELLRFTGHSDAAADDQFDSTALLSIGFDQLAEVIEEDFWDDEEIEMVKHNPRDRLGRNAITGY